VGKRGGLFRDCALSDSSRWLRDCELRLASLDGVAWGHMVSRSGADDAAVSGAARRRDV
jgi:hypothetical protein